MSDYAYRHESEQDDIESSLIQERYERFVRFLKMEGQTRSECRLLLYVVKEKGWCMVEIASLCECRNALKDKPWWQWLAFEWQEHVGEDWNAFPDYLGGDWL